MIPPENQEWHGAWIFVMFLKNFLFFLSLFIIYFHQLNDKLDQ